jgi:hypothetical protein
MDSGSILVLGQSTETKDRRDEQHLSPTYEVVVGLKQRAARIGDAGRPAQVPR